MLKKLSIKHIKKRHWKQFISQKYFQSIYIFHRRNSKKRYFNIKYL